MALGACLLGMAWHGMAMWFGGRIQEKQREERGWMVEHTTFEGALAVGVCAVQGLAAVIDRSSLDDDE